MRCRETAPDGCELGLCGKCCQPPCRDGVHHLRRSSRGFEGKVRRARITTIWHEAGRLADYWLEQRMSVSYSQSQRLSKEQARHIVSKGLKTLAENPYLDIADEQIHPLLARTFPPGPLLAAVFELQKMFPTLMQHTPEPPWMTELPPPPPPRPRPRPPLVEPPSPDATEPPSPTGATGGAAASSSACAEHVDVEEQVSARQRPRDSLPECVDEESPIVLQPYNPEGRPVFNKCGQSCAHFERIDPPILYQLPLPRQPCSSTEVRHERGRRILLQWMSMRPVVRDALMEPVERAYEWYDSPNSSRLLAKVHDVGRWFWFELRQWIPAKPLHCTLVNGTYCLRGNCYETGIHSASMYTLNKTLRLGLRPGPNPGKGGKTGVYCFRSHGRNATSSSGYAVYSDLDGSDIYFAPRYQLQIQTWRAGEAGIGNISVGSSQLCLQPSMFHLQGVWVHMILPEETVGRNDLWVQGDRWDGIYEES